MAEKNIKVGKIYLYYGNYILPVEKLRDRGMVGPAIYSVLFPDGTTDIISEAGMKEI